MPQSQYLSWSLALEERMMPSNSQPQSIHSPHGVEADYVMPHPKNSLQQLMVPQFPQPLARSVDSQNRVQY